MTPITPTPSTTPGPGPLTPSARARRRGFTLIELLVGVIILGIIASLLMVALRGARRAGQAGAERQNVLALRLAVGQFKDRYGFVPPLLKDAKPSGSPVGPVVSYVDPVSGQNERKFNIYDITKPQDQKDLRREGESYASADTRYSLDTLAYYLVGACEVRVLADPESSPIDGVRGPGFMPPNPDGTYKLTPAIKKPTASAPVSLAGRADPLIAVGKTSLQLVQQLKPDPSIGEPTGAELRNRKGQAYRYYRWIPDAKLPSGGAAGSASDRQYEDYYNIPIAVADWNDWKANPQLKNATYAVVLPGDNGAYGDEEISELASLMKVEVPAGEDAVRALRTKARADNLVEFGS